MSEPCRKAIVFCETGQYKAIGFTTGRRAIGCWLEGYVDGSCKRFIDSETQTLWYVQCPESVKILEI